MMEPGQEATDVSEAAEGRATEEGHHHHHHRTRTTQTMNRRKGSASLRTTYVVGVLETY